MRPPTITIDGPSGTGKGTLAVRLTQRLGWHLLDSGAFYRVVAYVAQGDSVALDCAHDLAAIAASLPLEFHVDGDDIQIRLDGLDARLQSLPPSPRCASLYSLDNGNFCVCRA